MAEFIKRGDTIAEVVTKANTGIEELASKIDDVTLGGVSIVKTNETGDKVAVLELAASSAGNPENDTEDYIAVVSSINPGAKSASDSQQVLKVGYHTLPTKHYVDRMTSGTVKYLGTVSSITEVSLVASHVQQSGDYVRAIAEFDYEGERVHIGDILIAIKDTSSVSWDVGHMELDSDTWQANSKTAAGYVAPGQGSAGKVWGVDNNGNPGWFTYPLAVKGYCNPIQITAAGSAFVRQQSDNTYIYTVPATLQVTLPVTNEIHDLSLNGYKVISVKKNSKEILFSENYVSGLAQVILDTVDTSQTYLIILAK